MALAMSGILLIIAQTYPKTIRGLREWSLAALAIALCFPLFIARDHIPDLLSIILANLTLLLAFMAMNIGTRKFAGTPPKYSRVLLALFVLLFVALFVWFTYVQPDIRMRVGTMVLFTLIVVLDQLLLVLRALPRTMGRHILVSSLAIMIVSRLIRLGALLIGFAPPTGVFDASAAQLVYIAIPALTIPLGTISLIMLASEKLRHDLEFISRHDGLTKCLNKNAAMEELEREIAHTRRHGNKLAIMLFDLDNFKDINDTHGHLEGDRILVEFARKVKASLRASDQLTRFGGDEFMAILPDADLEQARLVANRFQEAGRESQPIAWSVSIGISAWQDPDDTLDALLTRADKALYKSKALGRNQTQSI
ncbi:GGDEF domain-containing protein [Thiobacillus thioparus]|uniref:GGDEF domain-containing protein n=1 Tax=Thiobacillus thioparus TaxID=931 RepID=UPI001FDED8D7|nr:GGDEF domain-containing protein [Thiobacillus thioparus]